MICPVCKNEIPDDSQFCTCCGSKIEVKEAESDSSDEKIQFCTGCGSKLKQNAKFCVNCGKKISFINSDEKSENDKMQDVGMGTPETAEKTDEEPAKTELVKTPEVEPAKTELVKTPEVEPAKTELVKTPEVEPAKTELVKTPEVEPAKTEPVKTPEVEPDKIGPVKISKTEKKKTESSWLIPLIVVVVVLLFAAVVLLYVVLGGDKKETNVADTMAMTEEQQNSSEEIMTTEEVTEQTDTEDLLAGVNCDLRSNREVTLDGLIGLSGSQYILQWNESMSFGANDALGQPVRLDGVNNAEIDDIELPDGLLDSISSNERVTVSGTAQIQDNRLVIAATEIYDSAGNDLVESFYEEEDDYIIPDSDTRLLTEDDVEGLSLQEINYAKNEIYARHGRMFDSKELQDYFNSKSWYEGTISPNKFDKGGYISTVENKNAAFLAEMENKMGGPYQLDQ